MTSIAWDNGPIFRNGAVGTEQACCCGQDTPPCCSAVPTQCRLTLTLTLSDNSTLTYYWPEDEFDVLAPGSFGVTCNSVSASFGDYNPERDCGYSASKTQRIVCEKCCDDNTGYQCSLGSVTSELYTFEDSGCPGNVGVRVVGIAFSGLDCDPTPEPCNAFP